MKVTRREALQLAAGAGASVVMTAVDGMTRPVQALAIAGVDDAVVGGVVLALMTLAGYAVSAEVSQATLSAMGYSFSQFCADANNQSAAVTRAIADANNLGVEVQRAQAESAAQAIAAGTGVVGDWFADIAESGRIALDGVVNGVGAIPAALNGLIAQYASTLGVYEQPSYGSTVGGYAYENWAAQQIRVNMLTIQGVLGLFGRGVNLPAGTTWAFYTRTVDQDRLLLGGSDGYVTKLRPRSGSYVTFVVPSGATIYSYTAQANRQDYSTNTYTYSIEFVCNNPVFVSADLVAGPKLPGVDRAADAPETYGAGYDKTILGNDLVINPAGDVVSAGTIALPVDYPYVQLPYVDGLYQQGAGVVSGILDLPISGETSAVVGTEQGVATMPISQAVSSATSLAEVATPADPVVPPGTPDVGPWTPAYTLPFYEVWPFNMIYTYIREISSLGGAS